jgi:hypothetical protein
VDRWLRADGTFDDLSSLRGGPLGVSVTGVLGSGTYTYTPNGSTAQLQFQFTSTGSSPFPGTLQLAFSDSADGNLAFDGAPGVSTFSLRVAAADTGPVNLSNRAYVANANPAISGFIVSSPAKRFVLVRAIGPGLAAFQVSGVLADPYLEVHSGDIPVQRVVRYSSLEFNGDPAYFAQIFKIAGAFPLDPSLADSSAVLELPAGSCTVVVGSASGAYQGVVLTEIYFLP